MTSSPDSGDPPAVKAGDSEQAPLPAKAPVPKPRSKCKPSNSNPDEASAAATSQNGVEDHKKSPPDRPPPPQSIYVTWKPTAETEGSAEPSATPEAASEGKRSSPPPRPPPPSIYYDRYTSLRNQTNGGEDHGDTSAEPGTRTNGCVPLYSRAGESERPIVPPRLSLQNPPPAADGPSQVTRRSSCPGEVTDLQQQRPPSLAPPESIYCEIEFPPYLTILPDPDPTPVRTAPPNTLPTELVPGRNPPQSGGEPTRRHTSKESEEIFVMLRWLKKTCKMDHMAPSLYGLSIEEEIRAFEQRGNNVKQALRLYNLLMIKRTEGLRDQISQLGSYANVLDKGQKKTKTLNMAGGTAGAVGGVTAVLGIALAPVTFGASLVATAVGAGMVAAAGGIGAHAANATKNLVSRTALQNLLEDYKEKVVDMEHCLDFILSGMNELQRHDLARLQRAGARTDALRVAHLSQAVYRNNAKVGGRTSSERLLQAFTKELDSYFKVKDPEKLRKSQKTKFSGRVHLLGQNLQDELDYLNQMWEKFC